MPRRRARRRGRGAFRGASELIRLFPVRFACRSSRRGAGAGAAPALVLLAAIGGGCAGYKEDVGATKSIYDVRVTTQAKDVADCRLIERVDSRDTAKGCGLTVQPTPEECLRYQVRRAGGDTLLMNGPIGRAYACAAPAASAPGADEAAAPASTAARALPAPTPAATPAPPALATTAVSVAVPTPPVAATPSRAAVRISSDRATAKGCVYLGDVTGQTSCSDDQGQPSGDCVGQALQSGGDLILVDSARPQIFSCKARP